MARKGLAVLLLSLLSLSTALALDLMSSTTADKQKLVLPLFKALGASDPLEEGEVEVRPGDGKVEVEVEGAASNVVYAVVFSNVSGVVTIGSLQTDDEGDGELEAFLALGTYQGTFNVSRNGQTQFVTASISFSIGSSTQTVTEAGIIEVKIDPPYQKVQVGKATHFTVHVRSDDEIAVFLSLKDVIPGVIIIFTPNFGVADPTFNSRMTVVASANAQPGLYTLTVMIQAGASIFQSSVALEIVSETTVITTTATTAATTMVTNTTTTATIQAELSVTVTTDKATYSANETVKIRGQVADASKVAVVGASVSIQVVDPAGSTVYIGGPLTTNEAGVYEDSFRLQVNATQGTYTVFVTAVKGRLEARNHTTFVVGQSNTPNIIIKAIVITDTANSTKSEFRPGETLIVWVTVENTGAPLVSGIIWLQVKDPTGTPILVNFIVSTINTGQTLTFGFSVILGINAIKGIYSVSALVSDKFISQGGKFFTSGQAQFAVDP